MYAHDVSVFTFSPKHNWRQTTTAICLKWNWDLRAPVGFSKQQFIFQCVPCGVKRIGVKGISHINNWGRGGCKKILQNYFEPYWMLFYSHSNRTHKKIRPSKNVGLYKNYSFYFAIQCSSFSFEAHGTKEEHSLSSFKELDSCSSQCHLSGFVSITFKVWCLLNHWHWRIMCVLYVDMLMLNISSAVFKSSIVSPALYSLPPQHTQQL